MKTFNEMRHAKAQEAQKQFAKRSWKENCWNDRGSVRCYIFTDPLYLQAEPRQIGSLYA
jgi:hypothetical protein